MTHHPPDGFDELRGLLDALCEESITPEQIERLEQLVLADPRAEAYYVQYMSLHADLVGRFSVLADRTERSLRERVGVAHARTELEQPRRGDAAMSRRAGTAPRAKRRLLWGPLGLLGLAASVFVAVKLWSRPEFAPAPVNPETEAMDYSVAVLLQAPGAEWQGTGRSPVAGATLPAGWLRLNSGFAHIEFYSGATVILEGPAEFQLISRAEAFCARGKLRATVPSQAQGFKIGSPQLNVVDLGTEFGLEVAEGGKTEVHVFQGKVELNEPGSTPDAPAQRELTTGQGIRLEDSGNASAIPLNPAAFRTAHDLVERSEAATRRRHQDWLTANENLHDDPSLVVHFTFQSEQPWTRTLLNQANEQQTKDAAIVGCAWAAGRWPGKQSLEFKRVSDRARFNVPGEHASITLAAWVRVDALANRFNSLMITDGWEEGGPHWHIDTNGTLELGVQGPEQKSNAHYYAREAITTQHLRRWLHLAVVYDRTNAVVTHFVDGRPVARLPVKFDVPLRIGDAELGNWNVASLRNSSPVRYLVGCMDEFMFFSRALSEQEMERIYSLGRPVQ